MPTLLYQCPKMRMGVQTWLATDPSRHENDGYESITCIVCGRMHLVDRRTGKVVSENDDE